MDKPKWGIIQSIMQKAVVYKFEGTTFFNTFKTSQSSLDIEKDHELRFPATCQC